MYVLSFRPDSGAASWSELRTCASVSPVTDSSWQKGLEIGSARRLEYAHDAGFHTIALIGEEREVGCSVFPNEGNGG